MNRACHGPVVRAGPGRSENSDGPGRAGPRPIVQIFDGPGLAAHEMWALYGPLRPAHEAAYVFSWAGPGLGPLDAV